MADPIQQSYRAQMNALAEAIDKILNEPGQPKRIAFTLLIAEFGVIEGGRVNYISNGERSDMTSMLRETLARFEGRVANTPGQA